MILVDSSVWIALLRGEATPQTRRLSLPETLPQILIGDLILMEILQGARDERHAEIIQTRLSLFPIAPLLGPAIAVKAAANYRLLRERGITIRKSANLIIATFCIENGHRLLHQDRDFDSLTQHCGLQLA